METWYYLVKIVMGTAYDDVQDPEFRFQEGEKEKMLNFIDICIENGHEIRIIKTTPEFDK